MTPSSSSALRLPVSAVILARDAEQTLARCLDSLTDFDEVLLYDNGSRDGTLAIAARYANVRIVQGTFDGFGPTRNRAAGAARHDWIFNIDSDEWLTPRLRDSLKQVGLENPGTIYTFIRRNLMFGHVPRSLLGWELIHRLYHRRHTGWTGKVHESIGPLDGSPMRTHKLAGELWHDPYRSVGHLFHKRWIYAQPELRDRLKPLHPGLAALRALWRFLRCYVIQVGFVDGWRGFVVSVADAYGTFLKYTWAYQMRVTQPSHADQPPHAP
jgi:glycosyltransferase involved in cell wall biosynthesis